jgi:hypothetical protein
MGYLLDTDLAKARESLAHIQRASEAELKELRLTVADSISSPLSVPSRPVDHADPLLQVPLQAQQAFLRIGAVVSGL